MNIPQFGILLLALNVTVLAAEEADQADLRTARILDRANAESKVSGLTVTNTDVRFGFQHPDDHDRIVVGSGSLALAIPLRAVTGVALVGANWTVKYQTAAGAVEVTGSLAPGWLLNGNSDFGTFTLPLGRLQRLEFAQPGVATKPARRPPVYNQAGAVRAGSFEAVLTLDDGTRLEATQLRRNQVYVERVSDPTLLGQADFAVGCTNYTDFRLLRGETLQTIPFENVKATQFLPGDEVLVRAKSGVEATMKVPRPVQEILEGFNGVSSKGDFYVPLKFVKSITFGADAK